MMPRRTTKREENSPRPKNVLSANERDLRIRRGILDTAAELFFQHGYDAVSVDAIVEHAGGSKTNVYRQFGGKDGLLDALVEYESARLRKPLEELDVSNVKLEEGLALIARTYLSLIYDGRAVGLHRLVIAQGKKFPTLAATFTKNGPEGSVQRVATIFSRWKQDRMLVTERDTHVLARQFLDLLKVKVHSQLLLGVAEANSKKDRQLAISEGIQTFLHGVHAPR